MSGPGIKKVDGHLNISSLIPILELFNLKAVHFCTNGSLGTKYRLKISYFYLKNYLALTQWTPFGSCSVTCGVGEKSRERSCYSGDCADFAANNNHCKNSNCYVETENVSCDEGDCK